MVWRTQVGEYGWLRSVHNGAPVLTALESQAQQWPNETDAVAVLATLPASEVTRRVVSRPATP